MDTCLKEGLEVKILDISRFLLVGWGSFMESFIFEQQVLFRIDICSVTSDSRVQWPRVGLVVKI